MDLTNSKTSVEIVDIANHDDVLRRLYSGWIINGELTSMAFLDRKKDEPSVHLERLADAGEVLRRFPQFQPIALARLGVGLLRKERLGDVKHDPKEKNELQDADDSHCLIVRNEDTQSLGKKSRAKEIAKLATVIWRAVGT